MALVGEGKGPGCENESSLAGLILSELFFGLYHPNTDTYILKVELKRSNHVRMGLASSRFLCLKHRDIASTVLIACGFYCSIFSRTRLG